MVSWRKIEDDGQPGLLEVVNGDKRKGDAELEVINRFKNRAMNKMKYK